MRTGLHEPKSGAHASRFDRTGRQGFRVVVAQSVLVAFQLMAANLRMIAQFVAKKPTKRGAVRSLHRRRWTRPLADFAPSRQRR